MKIPKFKQGDTVIIHSDIKNWIHCSDPMRKLIGMTFQIKGISERCPSSIDSVCYNLKTRENWYFAEEYLTRVYNKPEESTEINLIGYLM